MNSSTAEGGLVSYKIQKRHIERVDLAIGVSACSDDSSISTKCYVNDSAEDGLDWLINRMKI